MTSRGTEPIPGFKEARATDPTCALLPGIFAGGTDAALAAEARRWYHDSLPGGMPMDWIKDATEDGLARAAMAAALSFAGRMHITEMGAGTTYSVARLADCVACQERGR